MRLALIFFAVLSLLSACDRPPAQKDIPVKNAPQNSVDHSGTHGFTMQSSPGAASAPVGLQYIDTMIAHHQGAIDMAQLVQTRAAHPQLKEMAQNIITTQQKEIEAMRVLRAQYFKDDAQAVNMDLPGMRTGMERMDLDKLDSLKENLFDIEFLDQMVPHHEGAIEMAEFLLSQPAFQPAEFDEALRSLARSVIDAQKPEIAKMKEWKSSWSRQG